MVQITDVLLRKLAAGSNPISDAAVPGLRYEPGALKGGGKWILRFVSPTTGKRRDMGLGTYPEVGIKDARGRALDARKLIGNGQDPIDERNKTRTAAKAHADEMTFEAAARKVHEDIKSGWKNPKHADQWLNTLETYVFPKLGKRNVAELEAADFAEALRPIWLTKVATADRVKQRCKTVMEWCWANKLVKSIPVDVAKRILPKQPGKRERVQHHPSMPWRDVPAFVQGVIWAGPTNVTRALLEFVILTAARSGEARAMTWEEVDLEARVWTVPATRMKAKVTHRVPLSERGVEILKGQRDRHPDTALVFPAPQGGIPTDMILTSFLRKQKAKSGEKGRFATAHGFRSSFRDWASENNYTPDWAERALAHTIKNQAEAAYHRTDLLEPRRTMMEAWAHYVTGNAAADNVLNFQARA